MATVTEQMLEVLRTLDTCAVSDALDSLGIAGAISQLSPQTVPKRIVGRCVTVQLVESGEAPDRHLCTAAVAAAGPDDIIVVSAGGRLDAGGWGGVLSQGASFRGVQGVVLDGATRDVDEAVDLDFAVYARGASPVTARGRVIERDWNVDVTIVDVRVSPGDYVIADRTGVVIIPADRIDEVTEKAVYIQAREAAMVSRILDGEPMPTVMGHDYETLLRGSTP